MRCISVALPPSPYLDSSLCLYLALFGPPPLLSFHPLSYALCLVYLRLTGASHLLFASDTLRPMMRCSSILLGLLFSFWPLFWFLAIALILRAQVLLALFMDPF
ncbi:unnamed protein product [Ilex paraguariensis]|uniref:Uncharacterized protein n=1 Tax=Ilex paraguariensis TaxID=185542 RepID=A0ABC8TJ39_9AQUA